MARQAHVTSIESLEAFRASLILFLAKARRSLDDAGDEVRRTRAWLQHEQRVHWEHEVRKRAKLLEQAELEYMSARLAGHREAMLTRHAAVLRAKRAIQDAEEKLRVIKQWNQNFECQADPAVKRLEGLRQLLDHDMPKAVAFLANAQRALDNYAETAAPSGGETLTPTREGDLEPGVEPDFAAAADSQTMRQSIPPALETQPERQVEA